MHNHCKSISFHSTELTPSARGLKALEADDPGLVEADDPGLVEADEPGLGDGVGDDASESDDGWDELGIPGSSDASESGLSEPAVVGRADPGLEPGRGEGIGEREIARDSASALNLLKGSSSSSSFLLLAEEGRCSDVVDVIDSLVAEREAAAERSFSKGSSSCLLQTAMCKECKLNLNA